VEIAISKSAGRALRRSNKRDLIVQKIEELAARPRSMSGNVTRLRGKAAFRLWVQDWRIIFRIEGDTLLIDAIEPRGSVYEDRT
jgi:mRNA interferase RelE/StbE